MQVFFSQNCPFGTLHGTAITQLHSVSPL